MTVWMVLRKTPPLPFLDKSAHGRLAVIVPFVWLGSEEEGAKLMEPLRDVVPSLGEHMGFAPWAVWQAGFDGLVGHGARNYWKSHHLKDLSDDCIEIILDFAQRLPTDECEVFIPHMEGAPARVAAEDTAFGHRGTPFVLNIHTRWQNSVDDERCLEWARQFHSSTDQHANGVYVNFLSDEGKDRVKDAYTPEIWHRLVELKRRYDPDNLFSLNQNIEPAG
jgi:FAD/FMN-containing dehydrogenase